MEKEVERFKNFLTEHGHAGDTLDARGGSFLNLALVAFIEQWKKRGWVPVQPNSRSAYRFMREDCAIDTGGMDAKTYGSKIAKMMNPETGAADGVGLDKMRVLVAGAFA